MTTLLWFRDDVRLGDHAALSAAAQDPDGMVALYVLDERSPTTRPIGAAARWWLHGSLLSLQDALANLGVPLILRRGAAATVVPEVVAECSATRVVWNRRYGAERHTDAQIKSDLREQGIEVRSFVGGLLFEPWKVTTNTGSPYRVYTPFWRACQHMHEPEYPLAQPKHLRAAKAQPASEALADWVLRPTAPDWATEFSARWQPGEASALKTLDEFLDQRIGDYAAERDLPAEDATSELSPHLRWGEISPRTVWHRAIERLGSSSSATSKAGHSAAPAASGPADGVATFLAELGWREFAWHTAFHRTVARADSELPVSAGMHLHPINARFEVFPWQHPDADELRAWQRGETGFGLIDAGMRELWRTGFMHNRVRMVVASFLAKNLLTDWRVGEAWFWDTLVDADEASNPFNWQWVAGCGADAAPYFRSFNPVTQQQRFDEHGTYVDRWAPDSAMRTALVDLKASRARALNAYNGICH